MFSSNKINKLTRERNSCMVNNHNVIYIEVHLELMIFNFIHTITDTEIAIQVQSSIFFIC